MSEKRLNAADQAKLLITSVKMCDRALGYIDAPSERKISGETEAIAALISAIASIGVVLTDHLAVSVSDLEKEQP